MAAKKSSIKKPVLPIEEVLIPELSDEPVRVQCVLQTRLDTISDEQKKYGGVGWSVILAYMTILDDDNDPVLTVPEWEVFQAANRDVWEADIVPVLTRVNGFDRLANKKKSSSQKSG